MREIKFRSWDIDNKVMIYSDDPEYLFMCGRDGNLYCWKRDDESLLELHVSDIMVLTGLKDRNGKDIYEGDIIQDNLGIGKVEYRETRAGYRVTYADKMAKWFCDYTDSEFKTIEVIGNIYEEAN